MSVEHIDKLAIAKSFGKAAERYDSVAHFQRWVGQQLLEKIPENGPEIIVDLGCGTGSFYGDLKRCFSQADYYGVDLSEQMFRFASNKQEAHWLTGDAEKLPLKSHSVDLVFSSLSIQWSGDLSNLFDEVGRVLSDQGLFVFSTLVDGSLTELKQAWTQVDGIQHVNAFAQLSDYQKAIVSSKLQLVSLEQVEKVLHYEKVQQLTRELKTLGAHNITSHRSLKLTGKQRIQKFLTEYEKFRLDNGELPATYQVVFGVLCKRSLSNGLSNKAMRES